jgi:hypothetical protein
MLLITDNILTWFRTSFINLVSPDKTCKRFSFHFPTRTVYRLLLGTIQNILKTQTGKENVSFTLERAIKTQKEIKV